MQGIFGIPPGWGLTIARIATGLLFLVHGWEKFFMVGIPGVSAYFGKLSIPLPGLMAPFIATLEVVGGALLIIGLFTRWVGLLFAIEMVVTAFWVQIPMRGWDASDLDRVLLGTSLLLFISGPGCAAVDGVWRKEQ